MKKIKWAICSIFVALFFACANYGVYAMITHEIDPDGYVGYLNCVCDVSVSIGNVNSYNAPNGLGTITAKLNESAIYVVENINATTNYTANISITNTSNVAIVAQFDQTTAQGSTISDLTSLTIQAGQSVTKTLTYSAVTDGSTTIVVTFALVG